MQSEAPGKDMSMSAIGETLKSAREKKNISLQEAQKQTHIHSTVLVALEEGRCDEMLTSAYVRSFLKKYSSYLGLDSKEFLSKYSAIHPETSRMNLASEKKEPESSVDISRIVYGAIVAIVLILALLLVTFLSRAVAGHFKKAQGTKSRAVSSKNKASSGENSSGKKRTDLSAKRSYRKEYSQDIAAAPAVAQNAGKRTILNLVLKVKQPVLVQLRRDGDLLFKRVLPKGAIELYSAYDSINIYAAKAEAIDLTLNGKPIDLPDKGVIKDLEITRRGVRFK